MENCIVCAREIDTSVTPFTNCSKCKGLFCDALHHTCFSKHMSECKGVHMTIMDPGHMINLISTEEL